MGILGRRVRFTEGLGKRNEGVVLDKIQMNATYGNKKYADGNLPREQVTGYIVESDDGKLCKIPYFAIVRML